MQPALSLPNIQEWIIIAVVAVLLFGRRLPEVVAQVLHGIRVARRHLDDLRRSSGFDEDLREAQRAISETRETVKREARELTAPIPTVRGAKDAVRRELTGIGSEVEESIRRTPPPTAAEEGERPRPDPAAPARDAGDRSKLARSEESEEGAEPDPERGSSPSAPTDPSTALRGPDLEPRDPDR